MDSAHQAIALGARALHDNDMALQFAFGKGDPYRRGGLDGQDVDLAFRVDSDEMRKEGLDPA